MSSDELDTKIKRYLKVTHAESWHGGSSRIKVAVFEETDKEIRGRKFRDSSARGHQLMGRITIRKDNVAAWEEFLPMPDQKSKHKVKEDYVSGRIDEEQMEEELEGSL
jgi:hypothetical protein